MGFEGSLGVSDIMVRWFVLGSMFLFLTYLFREKVLLEGLFGYFLPLCVLVPINVWADEYLGLLQLPVARDAIPYAYFTVILVFNVILLLVFNKILPGLTCSSNIALIVFAIVFSVISYMIGSYFPSMPGMPVG